MMRFLTVLFGSLLFSCVSAFSQTTVFSATFQSDGSGNAGYSARIIIPNISTGGSQIRVTMGSDTTGAFAAGHAAICVRASGKDCQATPVELKFSGAAGFSNPTNAPPLPSDWTNFPTTAGQDLIVILDVTSGPVPKNGTGTTYWSPTQVPSWNVIAPSGTWPSYALVYGPTKVEVQNGTPPPPPPSSNLTAPGLPGGGRLTIAHGVSRLYQDTQAGFIDYAPDVGTTVPMIFAGSVIQQSFVSNQIDTIGLTLALDNSWAANSLHDSYIAPGPALCSAPWTSVPDALVSGIKVNGAAFNCRTGPGTQVACAVNACSYLGSFKISPVAGVIRCDFTSGKNRECGIWNKDNRVDGVLLITDPTATAFHYELSNPSGPSTPPGNQVRPVNGDVGLNGAVLVGRLGPLVDIDHTLNHRGMRLNGEQSSAYAIGIGWNDQHGLCGSTVYSGNLGTDGRGINSTMNQEWFTTSGQIVIAQTMTAWCRPAPYQGIGTAYATEWQVWYSGQNWIDSGDFMMKMKFRY